MTANLIICTNLDYRQREGPRREWGRGVGFRSLFTEEIGRGEDWEAMRQNARRWVEAVT